MREPSAGQIIAGKYRLESLIGHGGMGSVWKARHATLDMPVAIKFMAPQALADAESRQRFDREARALAALRTPHIVQVLDHGVDGDTPYIVMELLEGEDLSSRLALRRRLPLDEVSRILSHVARALRRAHEAGITHRDLKPSNIFLARVDDEEIAKVLDFGVAKLAQAGLLTDDALTKAGTLLGSPGYMSPEQARGKEVDFRSDLWALAVIVFRAVTGQKPFAGDSIAELVIKLCIDPRPVPSRIAPDLPPGVDRFFEKAFAATPEERFHSAIEMASAFASIVGQPNLEVSHSGPSPFAGLSRSWLEAPSGRPVEIQGAPGAPPPPMGPPVPPPPITPPSGPVPIPRPPPRSSPGVPAPAPPAVRTPLPPSYGQPVVTTAQPPRPPAPSAPDGTTVMAIPSRGASPAEEPTAEKPASPFQGMPPLPPVPPPNAPGPNVGHTTVVLPPLAASREPTPTPASFAGFAPSGAEASVPPAPGPADAPLPGGGLRPPPPAASDPQGLPHLRLQSPTLPRISPPQRAGARPPIDVKLLVAAAAGAAILAIFFSLAIAGLRRRHTNALRPMDDETSEPAPSAAVEAPSATAAPADTPSAATTEAPGTTTDAPPADPSASATAEPAPTPTPPPVAPKPIYTAPKPKPTTTAPKPTSTTTKPKPKPTATGKTAPAPTSTQKKKPGTR